MVVDRLVGRKCVLAAFIYSKLCVRVDKGGGRSRSSSNSGNKASFIFGSSTGVCDTFFSPTGMDDYKHSCS